MHPEKRKIPKLLPLFRRRKRIRICKEIHVYSIQCLQYTMFTAYGTEPRTFPSVRRLNNFVIRAHRYVCWLGSAKEISLYRWDANEN